MNLKNYLQKSWKELPDYLDATFAALNHTAKSIESLTGWSFTNTYDDLDRFEGAYVVKEDEQKNILSEYVLIQHLNSPVPRVEVVMDSRLSYHEKRKGLVSLLTDLDLKIDVCTWVRPMNTLLGIYQQDVDTSLQKFTVKYWSPHEMLASLVEEVGEVSREINNQFGPKKKKPGENSGDLGGELADVMFSVICIANEQKINLDEVWARVMVKYELRDSNRFERKK